MNEEKIVLREDGDFERQYTPVSDVVSRSGIEENLRNYKAQAIEAIKKYNDYVAEITKYREVDPTLATDILTEPLPDLSVEPTP